MRIQKSASIGATVAILIVGATYLANHAASGSTLDTSERKATAVGRSPLGTNATIEDEPCDLEAVPALPASLDPRVSGAAAETPFAREWDPAKASSRSDAIDRGVALSSNPDRVERVAAARLPFAQAGALINDPEHPLVAPTRCAWLVTVDGLYRSEDQRPGGTAFPPVRGYTFLMDAASGEIIDLQAGDSIPNLITGEGLAPLH